MDEPVVIEIAGGTVVRPGEVVGVYGDGVREVLERTCGAKAGKAGDVRVGGADPYRDRGRVFVGVLWAEDGLYGELTPGEVVGAWRRWSGRSLGPDAERALDSLRRDVAYRDLTEGERRRFDLAMVLVGRPDALVVAEPATGLDAAESRELWTLLRALSMPVLAGARHRPGLRGCDRILPWTPQAAAA